MSTDFQKRNTPPHTDVEYPRRGGEIDSKKVEAERQTLIHKVALALYTIEYINKHNSQWLDANLSPSAQMRIRSETADPAYIRHRFDAHQGTGRYYELIKQAEMAVDIVMEVAASVAEALPSPYPHDTCVSEPTSPGDPAPAYSPAAVKGEHTQDCPDTIAARLRAFKSVS